MADRVAGVPATLYADLPGLSAPVTATLIDATGASAWTGPATLVSGSRWQAVVPGENLLVHGQATITWADETHTRATTFLVGPSSSGLSRWDLRMRIARRQNTVVEGTITAAANGSVIDADLLGAPGNYKGRFVMLHPESGVANAGITRRVTDFNGSALILSRPFPTIPAVGVRYALFSLDPREIDAALVTAVAELAGRGRVPVTVSGLTVAESAGSATEITIPEGLVSVDTVYGSDGTEVEPDLWEIFPGRRLAFTSGSLAADSRITITGIRNLAVPVWDDSIVEFEPSTLVARAAMELLATRAGGGGTDVKEHLRRQMLTSQEYEASLKMTAGRLPGGSRAVID